MKVKDLEGINPEAEIKVIMPNCLPYKGKLDWGWSSDDCDSKVNSKTVAKEVDIFLGNISEYES